MIKLPSYEWFMGQLKYRGKGNVFSGSYGCDPISGGINNNQLRFRAWIEKDGNDNWILCAVHYKGKNCFEMTDQSEMAKSTFDATVEGILSAEKWINDSIFEYKSEVENNE